MAKTKEIGNFDVTLKVTEVTYTPKGTNDERTFNKYTVTVDGRDYDISLAPADKKLFEYILGI